MVYKTFSFSDGYTVSATGQFRFIFRISKVWRTKPSHEPGSEVNVGLDSASRIRNDHNRGSFV
jgi:hypothetical protein